VTHFNSDWPPGQRQKGAIPRWLAVAITVLAFSAPIAGMLMLVWPVLLQRTGIAADDVELICLAAATVLIASAMASYVHRDRGIRL
jgi:hypothetical protein